MEGEMEGGMGGGMLMGCIWIRLGTTGIQDGTIGCGAVTHLYMLCLLCLLCLLYLLCLLCVLNLLGGGAVIHLCRLEHSFRVVDRSQVDLVLCVCRDLPRGTHR